MKIGQQIATDDECAEKQEIQSILDDKVISDWENIEVSASEVTEMMREFLGLVVKVISRLFQTQKKKKKRTGTGKDFGYP